MAFAKGDGLATEAELSGGGSIHGGSANSAIFPHVVWISVSLCWNSKWGLPSILM